MFLEKKTVKIKSLIYNAEHNQFYCIVFIEPLVTAKLILTPYQWAKVVEVIYLKGLHLNLSYNPNERKRSLSLFSDYTYIYENSSFQINSIGWDNTTITA